MIQGPTFGEWMIILAVFAVGQLVTIAAFEHNEILKANIQYEEPR